MTDLSAYTFARVDGDKVRNYGTLAQALPHTSPKKGITVEQLEAELNVFVVQQKAVGPYQVSIPTTPYVQDGSVYDNQVRDMRLDEALPVAEEKVREIFHEKADGGLTIGGVQYDTTRAGRQELIELVTDLKSNPDKTQKFVTRSGAVVVAGVEDAEAIHSAIAAHISHCREHEAVLLAAIKACTTVDELREIDLTAGWEVA